MTRAACERAIGASRELGEERRLPAADYLIAAAAAERGFGVLHDDRQFDPLCRALGMTASSSRHEDASTGGLYELSTLVRLVRVCRVASWLKFARCG